MSMKSTSLARLLSVEVPGQANILTQILHLFHRLNECFKIEIGFFEVKGCNFASSARNDGSE
jgi:hypothetical protein